MPNQQLSHVVTARPKMNRRPRKKKKRKGLRKAFETEAEMKVKEVKKGHARQDTAASATSGISGIGGARPAGVRPMSPRQLEAIANFSLPEMKIREATKENALELIKEMEEALNRLVVAEKKLEVTNHGLRTDINLMRQRTLKLEEEFCYRYPSAKADEKKVKEFAERGGALMDSKTGADTTRYYQGVVNWYDNKKWKMRYLILTARYLEVYKTDKAPKQGVKPYEVIDMAGASITKVQRHPNMDRKCMKMTANTGKKQVVYMFVCNSTNDNQAWNSGVNNRRLHCSYEDQCAKIKAEASPAILKFLAQWRFASEPVTLDMCGQNLDVLSAGIISRCLSDPCQPSNPIAQLVLSKCNLNDMKVNDVSVGLVSNRTVVLLDLSRNTITGNMAKALARALEQNHKNGGALKTLKLDDCEFKDKAAAEVLLAGICKSGISALSLQRCAIDDHLLEVLSKGLASGDQMKSLCSLDLSFNSIHDQGAKALAEAIKRNHFLTELVVAWNEIGEEGGATLAGALEANRKLQSFDFQGNPIGEKATAAFTRIAQVNTCLRSLSYGANKLNRQHMSVMHLLNRYGFATSNEAKTPGGAVVAKAPPAPGARGSTILPAAAPHKHAKPDAAVQALPPAVHARAPPPAKGSVKLASQAAIAKAILTRERKKSRGSVDAPPPGPPWSRERSGSGGSSGGRTPLPPRRKKSNSSTGPPPPPTRRHAAQSDPPPPIPS